MNTQTILRALLLVIFSFYNYYGFAADRFWVATTSSNWNNLMNWSVSSGGAPGASIPGSFDQVFFDGGSSQNCAIDTSTYVGGIAIQGTYSGTITVNSGINLTMNTYTQAGGTFTGSDGNMDVYGGFNLTGGIFNAPSGILKLGGAYSRTSGTFNHSNGTVAFASNTLMPISGNTIFYDLILTALGGTYDVASGTIITSLHNVVVNGGAWMTINTGVLEIKGDLTLQSTTNLLLNGGTATFLFNGTGIQNIVSSIATLSMSTNEYVCGLPNVEINKTSGSLNLSGVINMNGLSWITTNGAGLINPGTSTLNICTSVTFSGQDLSLYNIHILANFQNITLSPATYRLKSTHDLTINGGGFYQINTGIVEVIGDITLISSMNSSVNGGTATILINGTGNQSINSMVTTQNFVCALPNVKIDKPSGTLNLSGVINFSGNSWNTVSGSALINPGTSVVNVLGTATLSGQDISLYDITITGNWTYVTIASGVKWTSTHLITLAGGGAWYQIRTGTLNAKGDVLVTNTDGSWNVGGDAILLFDGSANQLLTGSGIAGAGRLPQVRIDKSGGVLTFANPIISTDNHWTYIAGNVDATTNSSTVDFYRNSTVDGQGTSQTMAFNHVRFTGPITLGGNLDVDGNLTINNTYSDCRLDASWSNYLINLAGNWTNYQSAQTASFYQNNCRVIFDGTGTQQLTLNSSSDIETFYELEMNNTGGGLVLNAPVVVTSNCNFLTGLIHSTTTNLIRIDNNATATGANNSGYVSGPVRKTGNQAFDFPVGKDGYYASIAISASSGATDEFTCEYFHLDPDPLYNTNLKEPTLDHISHCEYWILDRTTGMANVTVRPSWDTRSCGVNNLADLKVARWDGSLWRDHGNGGTTGNTTAGTIVTVSNVTNFSPFTLASATVNNPLPIELSDFNVTCEDAKAVIEWTTQSETNNSYFTIESTQNGQTWEVLGIIEGSGNSSTPKNYRFVNDQINNTSAYYRLRQTDNDGNYSFSSIEYLESCIFSAGSEQFLFPNPTTGMVYVNHSNHADLSITIFTATGQIVRQYDNVAEMIDISDLSDAVYFVRLSTDITITEKLVKRSN